MTITDIFKRYFEIARGGEELYEGEKQELYPIVQKSIDDCPDPVTRFALKSRYIDLLTWSKIADLIIIPCHTDMARKRVSRYLKNMRKD